MLVPKHRSDREHGSRARLFLCRKNRLHGGGDLASIRIDTGFALSGGQWFALAVAVRPHDGRAAVQPIPVGLGPGLAATGPAHY